MNNFHCTNDFFSFAARRSQPYCFRDETIRDPDVAVNFKSPGGREMRSAVKLDRVGKLSRPLAVLAALLAGAPLAAHETDPAYTMTVIVDAAHGSKVAAGKYERAIEKITSSKSTRDEYSRQTNLCVAYTKTGELDKATSACEAALAIALGGRKTGSGYLGSAQSQRIDRMYRALALSNLGVLHAAKGSPDFARRSFREALQLETSLSAPRINLARLAQDETPSA
jgi:tetratricopeptide (TPR) repeat protein